MAYEYIKGMILLLVLIILLVNPVIAGIIVKYDLSGSSNSVTPPVLLEEPSDTAVATYLNLYKTAANITVNIPSDYIISLESRRAVYWNTFDDYDPLATGELIPLNNDTCYWYWDSANGELVGETTGLSNYYGGECILLINRTIPVDKEIYLDINMMWDSSSTLSHYSDLVFMNKSTEYLYTIGNNYLNDRVYIYLWDGAWNLLSSRNFPGTFWEDTWYDLLGIRNNTNGYLAEIYQDNLIVDDYDTSLQVDSVGLGLYSVYGEIVRYDLLLVTLGGPPYYVNITGLQAGWYVEIYNESNDLIIGPVQATGTNLSIDFWDYKMVKNGTIVVYDSGYNYVTSNTFRWIIGGDTYRVAYSTYGSTFNILGFYNNDTAETFNVSLALVGTVYISSSVPGATLYEMDVWIESGGETSSSITLIYNSTSNTYEIASPITSTIELYPLYPGNIYLYWYGDPGISIEFSLLLLYWINGVLVAYPISVTVTS
ncbi:MAG: hypothetical protein GSR81_05285 [Desulfurococcales archaeon]|nr:hypothetical protein [Desulfurococcales archaeon]